MHWIVNKLNMTNIDPPYKISSCDYSLETVRMAIIGDYIISLIFTPAHIDGAMFIKLVN